MRCDMIYWQENWNVNQKRLILSPSTYNAILRKLFASADILAFLTLIFCKNRSHSAASQDFRIAFGPCKPKAHSKVIVSWSYFISKVR